MSSTTTSRAHRIIRRITATWAELDYAQRRMLEIQTGVTGLAGPRGRRTRVHDGHLGDQV